MSSEVKIKGELTVSINDHERCIEFIEDYELDAIDELVELFNTSSNQIDFDLHLHLTHEEAFGFSELIDEVMELASSGKLFYWAESLEENTYILLEVGKQEKLIPDPFPEDFLKN